MSALRSRLARFVPRGFHPIARRGMRQIDRIRGLPRAKDRPGVVLMLHVGRCGSTVLANLLDQHPAIYWDAKLPRVAKGLYGAQLAEMDFPVWTKRQFAISGDRFYGFEFKVLEDQYPALIGLSTGEFLAACREIGVTHYILLARRNTLRHVVSHYASRNRGAWHATEAGAASRKRSFRLDPDDITTGASPGRSLVDYLAEVETKHDEVRRLLAGERLLEIEYERDVDAAGAEHAYRMTCDFLGIDLAPVDVLNVRLNPYSLSEVLDNHAEIEARLEGTEYAWMAKD